MHVNVEMEAGADGGSHNNRGHQESSCQSNVVQGSTSHGEVSQTDRQPAGLEYSGIYRTGNAATV